MTGPISHKPTFGDPQNRRILIVLGIILLALLIMAGVWQSTGERRAKRELPPPAEKVVTRP
jgi:FtsZ-interacting cell division protein ZipA